MDEQFIPEPRTVHSLPEDYQEVYFLRVTGRSQFIWLNVVSVGLMLLAVPVFYGWAFLYHGVLNDPLTLSFVPESTSTWMGLLIVMIIIPIHEWFHGLAIQHWGHPVRYGAKPLRMVVYATADGALFWRHQYVMVALAPLVGISLLLLLISVFMSPGINLWLMLAAVMNTAGAVGDIWMTRAAYRYPRHALIRDEEDGMRIFMPAG